MLFYKIIYAELQSQIFMAKKILIFFLLLQNLSEAIAVRILINAY